MNPKTPPLFNGTTSLAAQQQDVTATRFVMIGDHKCRATVTSNAFKFQSSARIHVWQPAALAWSLVHSIPTGKMATAEGLYVVRNVDAAEFSADLANLEGAARAILL